MLIAFGVLLAVSIVLASAFLRFLEYFHRGSDRAPDLRALPMGLKSASVTRFVPHALKVETTLRDLRFTHRLARLLLDSVQQTTPVSNRAGVILQQGEHHG